MGSQKLEVGRYSISKQAERIMFRLPTPVFQLFSILFFLFPSFLSSQTLHRYQFNHYQMGTRFGLILYGESDTLAKQASDLAFAKIDSLNQLFSDYLPDSELNQVSRQSGSQTKIRVNPELWNLLKMAQKLARQSKGAFDVTIGPLSHLWRKAFKAKAFPAIENIEAAQNRVGYPQLKICKSKYYIKLTKAGMQLDVGGIAKGYAADLAMRVLKERGIESALIDAGGDILVSAPPPAKSGWSIQVEAAQSKAPLLLSHCAVATSGDTYQFLEWEGKKYSHIIDPRTGYGLSHQLQVTVTAPNGSLADGLASAISVMGKEKGEKWSKRFKNCQVFILKKE